MPIKKKGLGKGLDSLIPDNKSMSLLHRKKLWNQKKMQQLNPVYR